jgi:low affinity Fe/Cu permease
MNMNVIPVPLVALIGIYAIAKVILDTTRDLHSLRDITLRTKKLEVTHPVDIARIRVAALSYSYIPLWQGICIAHIVLMFVFGLTIFEIWTNGTSQCPSSQNNHPVEYSTKIIYTIIVSFSIYLTILSLQNYLKFGLRDIHSMNESICETIRLPDQEKPPVPSYSCWNPIRIFKLLKFDLEYPAFVAQNWVAPRETPPQGRKSAEGPKL